MNFNWTKLGIDVGRIKTEGKTTCPKCGPTRKNKRDKSLSVNVITGDYNCHNTPCDFRGNVANNFLDRERPQRVYVKPLPKLQKVNDKVLQWFNKRGISNNTLLLMKVTEDPTAWMPQDEQHHHAICFNYFRNEELVNIKYRTGEKFFKMEKGAELIFYNLDALTSMKRKFVIIVEGEVDCLSWVECGVFAVISVPNGANQARPGAVPNLEYLDNCWRELEEVPVIILAMDNDEPGEVLKRELIRRLGPERCFTVRYPEGCKDTNDVLVRHGQTAVTDMIKKENLVAVPIDGVMTLEDMESDADYIYNYGYPTAEKIGWKLDEHITWLRGDTTVITGIPNHGKSTWLQNVVAALAQKSDWRIAIFSPEKNRSSFIIAELASVIIGLPTFRKDPAQKMSLQDWNRAKDFIHEHFLFVKTTGIDMTLDGLLLIGEKMVKRYGIHGYVIDPWNYVETDIPFGTTETVWLGNQLGKAADWAKLYNVHLWFVAHPTKMQKDKKTYEYLVPGMYDISGSAHWNNKIDNGICVYRNWKDGTTTVYIQKVRWFFVGRAGGSVKMTFEPEGQRFVDYIPPPDLSPAEASYEEKKANAMVAARGREIITAGKLPFGEPPAGGMGPDDLPF